MAHVDVSASAVEEETAVAGGLIPIALVHIRQAEASAIEDPVSDAAHGAGRTGRIIGQASIFGF